MSLDPLSTHLVLLERCLRGEGEEVVVIAISRKHIMRKSRSASLCCHDFKVGWGGGGGGEDDEYRSQSCRVQHALRFMVRVLLRPAEMSLTRRRMLPGLSGESIRGLAHRLATASRRIGQNAFKLPPRRQVEL